MAVTAFASGTQTATVTTEHTLASVNVAGTYRLMWSRAAMGAGDVVTIRVKGKVLAGSTKAGIEVLSYSGAPASTRVIEYTDAYETDLAVTDGLEFTLTQEAGTSRTYEYSIHKIA
jgi:hypothetical protein